MKAIRRYLLVLILALSALSPRAVQVQAQSSGKTAQSFANLVLFVQFKDTAETNFMDHLQKYTTAPTTYTQAAVRDYYDRTYAKSLASYMDTISYGQFQVNSYMPQLNAAQTQITPIVLSGSRSYYDDWSTIYLAEKEALDLAKQNFGIDSADYDLTGDDYVDNVTFIFAGEEDSRGNAFYAHKTDFGPGYTINGKSVGCINVLMADTMFLDDMYATGEIAHEFMHSIGYPDLYHEGDGDPVGPWDIMAQASLYNQWPLAYMRASVSNWLTINTITQDQALTLDSADQKDGNQAYILKTNISDSEFFVVEYRKQGTRYSDELDVKIPGSGLIIYRINTRVERLSNRLGDGVDGVYVFRPGETSVSSDSGNMQASYLSKESGRTSYGTSDMSKTIADGAIVYSDNQNSGIVISNVGSASGDSITFNVSFTSTSNIGLWDSLGGSSVVSTADNSVLSMAVKDGAQYPSVLIGDYNNEHNYKIAVYDYSGTAWTKTTSDITDFGSNAVLAYLNGVPYVLYCASADSKFKLVKYADSQWKTVKYPVSSLISSNGTMTSFGGKLYLAWEEGDFGFSSSSFKNYIVSYDGTSFTDLKTYTDGYYAQFSFSNDGSSVYLSCRNASSSSKTVALQITGTAVKELPVPETGCSDPKLGSDGTDLYLLQADEVSTGLTYLYKYSADRTSVAKVSTALSEINSSNSSIWIYDGIPLVQAVDTVPAGSVSDGTAVYRFENNAWWKEGLNLNAGIVSYTDITMIGDMCYVSLMDGDSPYVKMKAISGKGSSSSTATISGIFVTSLKSSYSIGDVFSASDITVDAVYTNADRKALSYGTGTDNYQISGFDTGTAGTKTVTVTCGAHTDTYQITVSDVNVTGVSISPSALTLAKGSYGQLTAEVVPSNATNKSVTWSSGNTSVATVDSSGRVTAVNDGTAVITAASAADNTKTASCTITVSTSATAVTGVTLSPSSITLEKGKSSALTAAVLPSNATTKTLTWVSSNPSAVTVDSNGKITANAAGSSVITVTTVDGLKEAVCNVTVVVPVTGVTVSPSSLALTTGRSGTLKASVIPGDATNIAVNWTSSNPSVASVDGGAVKALKAGTASITVTTIDGSKTASCIVTVQDPVVAVTGVTVSSSSLTLTAGASRTLSASVTPANATNKSVTWSSSNPSVATVYNGAVTAVNGGSAVITVTTADGSKTASCIVTVTVPVTGVSVSPTSLSLTAGASNTLRASVSPSTATNKTIRWSSSNSSVASVNQGTVTAVSAGTAVITVTTEDGNKTAVCTVTVTAPPVPVKKVSVPMYRLYNPNSGEHFYTASVSERDHVSSVGWIYEGIGWYAPTEGVPVYRLYNANGGEHHYTLSADEKDMLVRAGWNLESSAAWYSDPNHTVPLYRQYNPNQFSCNHNYTTSKYENDYLVSIGWHGEGVSWYGVDY